MELRVGGLYRITKKLGQGSFGTIYAGVNIKDGKEVAIKLELVGTENPMLQYEKLIYDKLKGQPGFSKIFWIGPEGLYICMVMEILGPSLGKLFKFCDKTFSQKTLYWCAIQMLLRIQTLHFNGYLHRDLQPENILIAQNQKSLYLIDFGLSKRYNCPKTGKHITQKQKLGVTGILGTATFASLNAFCKMQQGRADDLESIGYILIYLAKGELPWAENYGRSYKTQVKFRKSISVAILCAGLPKCIHQYMEYVRNLEFQEKPNYEFCINLFEEANNFNQYKNDFEFDWTLVKEKNLDEKRLEESKIIEKDIKILSKQQSKNQKVSRKEERKLELEKKLAEHAEKTEILKKNREQSKLEKMQKFRKQI